MSAPLLGLWLLLRSVARAECPDSTGLILRATQDVEAFYLAEAAAELEQAAIGFGCGPMASPELLSAWWQADGVMHLLQGQHERASLSLAAAASVA